MGCTFEEAEKLVREIAGDNYFALEKSFYLDGTVDYTVVIVKEVFAAKTISAAGIGSSWLDAIENVKHNMKREEKEW